MRSPDAPGGEQVAVVRMGHGNAANHLIPINSSRSSSKLWVVRPEPRPPGWDVNDATYLEIRARFTATRLVRTFFAALKLARRHEVTAVLSFNGVPYGLIAVAVGRLARKPVHVGFVGTETYKLQRRWYGRPLDRILRGAALYTVPGPSMAKSLSTRGYPADRIVELPHAVDLRHWVPPDLENRTIDLLFVGALEQHKQVDKIISSLVDVRERFPDVSLVVVGDGPERNRLGDLADRLGLSDHVRFVGYHRDPLKWYQSSRFVVIASQWEGFPFVLVEGMCTGAVPLAARVGAIADVIRHGETGYLFNGEDPQGLSTALVEVLADTELSEQMRTQAVAERERFGYEATARLWDGWLAALGEKRRPS